jgi:hypothetical protein
MNSEILNTIKTKMRIDFWNVHTMYSIGKLAQVTAEMLRYNLHVFGISKRRWTDSGRVTSASGEIALYSGR